MADSLPAPSQLILDDHPRLGRIHVDMEAFFDFSFWLAEELEDMKAQALHGQTMPRSSTRHAHRNDDLRGNQHRTR
ncbi:MAG TPA: hypothetical protein DCY79_02270 [Planctomycetaceae bacterium]|nr:hypothetical protein [Planctomycetaceae bacterium]|tara:strand:+ start:954 stop:1181 length:228 start_codon:yes stop_codon:yes gene_type:complete